MGGKQTSNSAPWAGQAPYLQGAYADISKMFQVRPSTGIYPGFGGNDPARFAPNYTPGSRNTGGIGGVFNTYRANAGTSGYGGPGSLPQERSYQNFYGGGGGLSGPAGSQQSFAPSWYGTEPAMRLAAGGPQPFQGDRVADFAPETELGLQMGAQRALMGSPVQQAAGRGLLGTIQGDYMRPGSNPFLDQTYGLASGRVAGDVDKRAALLGRTGSGAHLSSVGGALGGLANQIYGQNYQQERDRQMQAISQAPGFAASEYGDIDRLLGFGGQRQSQAQQELQAAMDQYSEMEQLPFKNVSNFLQLLSSGNWGGTTTTKTSPGALDIIGAIF